ncbi:taurine transporter subunit [Halalkalicoccus paucihalophilus]|uniref:Taurine transporter subunit n=1 Tax=Halalkalicoccus paucihalophilus TaxID=1008153 RepID=A0A151AI98_9EURY|nr:ABC transporter permease [Halalkalicoccus paucihalophilus]KYH27127.1 taurine transporter subunit [Halalkalicoccus paucihalophilus]
METRRRLVRAGSVLAVPILWFLLTRLGIVAGLPTPTAVASSFLEEFYRQDFWLSVARSTVRVLVSFVVAAAVAIPLGLLIGRYTVFADLTFPALEMLRPIPPIAWIPFTILVLPASELSIMFITFLGAFFPILLNTIQGARGVEVEFSRAAQSLGAGSFQTFRHVIYPSALPAIHAGMIVGMGLAWVNLIAGEMVAGGTGLGFLTWSAYTSGSYPTIIVGIITIGVLGALSSALVRLFANWQIGWREVESA